MVSSKMVSGGGKYPTRDRVTPTVPRPVVLKAPNRPVRPWVPFSGHQSPGIRSLRPGTDAAGTPLRGLRVPPGPLPVPAPILLAVPDARLHHRSLTTDPAQDLVRSNTS